MSAHLLVGDVFEKAATLADGSDNGVITSPPFLALRSYLPPGGHDDWRPGVVLDPFAGSGTMMVALGLGRACIGIDLDERNADLVRDRVGMFLEVVEVVP